MGGINHPQLVGLLLAFPHYILTYRDPKLQRLDVSLTDPAAYRAGPAAHGAGPIQNDPGQTPRRHRWPVGSSDRLPDGQLDFFCRKWRQIFLDHGRRWHITLHYIILYFIVFYSIISYHIILYYIILYYIVSYIYIYVMYIYACMLGYRERYTT